MNKIDYNRIQPEPDLCNDLFGGDTTRHCQCAEWLGGEPCKRSLEGMNGKTKYHPICYPLVIIAQGHRRENKKWAVAYNKFYNYHRDNPGILVELKNICLHLMTLGYKKYGMDGVWCELRWSQKLKPESKQYKFDNNYRPHYQALIMQDKRFKGFFNLKGSVNVNK